MYKMDKMVINDPKWKRALEITSGLRISDADYAKVDQLLQEEMRLGLAAETHAQATLRMLPTYVHGGPDGSERGKFLALDLGGTKFRVLMIDLHENRKFNMDGKIFAIPQEIMTGTGDELFDHIAACIGEFLEEKALKHLVLPLGFTFSFPCEQTGLTSSKLIRWTKGFKASNVEGKDVVKLLLEAVERRRGDYEIEVVAVVNDTTGTLMSCAYKEPTCAMGLIVGTGTNACYIEEIGRVELFRASASEVKRHKILEYVIVNMEWGAFGDNGALDFVRTKFDLDTDKHSVNPGMQVFEKMISGMYMGELVRLVLIEMAEEKLIFGETGKVPPSLTEHSSFAGTSVDEFEKNDVNDKNFLTQCKLFLNEQFGIRTATDLDCYMVTLACESASARAARLCGTATATVLNHMGRETTTVAVDGSVYKNHPHFRRLMEGQMRKSLRDGMEVKLKLSEDGSGKGAALAAVAVRKPRGEKENMKRFDGGNVIVDGDGSKLNSTAVNE